jgi:acyl-CoA thioester hydrolase
MSEYRFYHPIEVRYGDLDPQGHVNNARYLTYIEQARIAYVRELGLWDGKSFQDIGIILAEAHVSYKAAILWGQSIRVGVRISRLGNKSFDWSYSIEDSETGIIHATAATIQVAYDYHTTETIPIPANWREIISDYEGIQI